MVCSNIAGVYNRSKSQVTALLMLLDRLGMYAEIKNQHAPPAAATDYTKPEM